MKKFMAVFFVAMLLVMSLGNIVTAMADVGTARPFSIYVQCMNSDSYTDEEDAFRKTVNNNMIYVRHWVTGGSDSYTNHFRGRKSLEGDVYTRVNCGDKWCTVNMYRFRVIALRTIPITTLFLDAVIPIIMITTE